MTKTALSVDRAAASRLSSPQTLERVSANGIAMTKAYATQNNSKGDICIFVVWKEDEEELMPLKGNRGELVTELIQSHL